jgi:tRNA (guanine37-N1)-methyltransferase
MHFIKVKKSNAKKLKDLLSQNSLLNNSYNTISEEDYILFPINDEKLALSLSIKNKIEVSIKEIDVEKKKEQSIELFLQESLGDSYSELRRGFDIIGDIAIIEETRGQEDKIHLIAKAVMMHHKHIKGVFAKEGIHDGNYRIQGLRHVLGEDNKETIHKENGYRIFLEVGNTYFSPRLSQERLRIAKSVKKDENVLVLFSGVAPYGISISKHSEANKIYCVELNPKAHEYALINVNKNKVKNVNCILGDAKEAIKDFSKQGIIFDRIIMPLPKTADDYLLDVLTISKNNTIIHWYSFSDEDNVDEEIINHLKSIFSDYVKYEIIKIQKTGQSSPGKIRVCTDIRIVKIL